MKALPGGRPVRVVIREIGITAASPIEARRLADAIGPALERAFARPDGTDERTLPLGQRPPDRVAARIAAAVAARLEGAR
jgi:hypothetical protein